MVSLTLLRVLDSQYVPESSFTPDKPGATPIPIQAYHLCECRAFVPRFSKLRKTVVCEEQLLEIKSDVPLEPGDHLVEIVLKKDVYRVVRVIPLQKLDFATLGKILTKSSIPDSSVAPVKKEAT